MNKCLLLLLVAGASWAAKYPIDSVITIPHKGYPAEEIGVAISQLDTQLVFFTTPATASCPGQSSGDIKNAVKKPTVSNPNPTQNSFLWNLTATCGTGPNQYTAQAKYYEYEFPYRGKTHYLGFERFVGPASFPSGTFPSLEFQILIDTVSHRNASGIGRGKIRAAGKGLKGVPVNLVGQRIGGADYRINLRMGLR
jgi:hypothetical protein